VSALNRAITASTRHPWATLVIVVLLVLAAVPGIIGFDRVPVLRDIDALRGIGGIEQDNSNDGYLGSFNRFYLEEDYIADTFGDPDSSVFISVDTPNIYSTEALELVQAIHERMEEIPLVTEVNSIINVEDVSGAGDTISTFDLIPKDADGRPVLPSTEAELAELRRQLEANDVFESYIYSKARNENGLPAAWNITVGMEETEERPAELINRLESEVQRFQRPGVELYLFGGAVLTRAVDNSGLQDLTRQVPLILLVICLIYFFNFHSVSGVFFPVTGNIISVLWTFSIIGYVGMKLAFIHLLLLPLLIALGSSYAIHLLNQYYAEAGSYTEKHKRKQIGLTIKHILKTISLAGLTTMVGLLSSVANRLVHLRSFGLLAGVGVLLSVVVAITYVPAMLALIRIPSVRMNRAFNARPIDRLIRAVNRLTVRHPLPILLAAGVLVLTSAGGAFFVSNDVTNTDYFAPDHQIRFLTDYFSENFDGVDTMSIVLDTRPDLPGSARREVARRVAGPARDDAEAEAESIATPGADEATADDPFATDAFGDTPLGDTASADAAAASESAGMTRGGALDAAFLAEVDGLARFATAQAGVGKSISFVDMVERFNYIMHNDREEYRRLPTETAVITDYVDAFGGQDENFDGLPDAFERFVDPRYNIVKITLKLTNVNGEPFDTGDGERLRHAVGGYIEEHFDTDQVHYLIAGGSMGMLAIQNYVVSGQIISIVVSLFAIAIITSLIFGSLRIGLVSIVPLGIAVLINFGVMGIFGIKLNIATALIASFAIGIGIDDTIHYLLNLRKEMALHPDAEIASPEARSDVVLAALKKTSKAIIFTSLALIFGFAVVGFSSFLPIRYFSLLVALTMVNATIATLVVLPAVVMRFPAILTSATGPRNSRRIATRKST